MKNNVLILGIGNLLWADEGFGVRAAEVLHQQYEFDDHVSVLDGGTQGIYLLEAVQNADILVIFDAIDFALAPGTLKCVEDSDVPNYMGVKKMSLHQTGFQEVLAMAEMLGQTPERLLLVGVQPVVLEDFGGSLHPDTAAQIPSAIDAALTWLAQFNIKANPRKNAGQEPLAGGEINRERYESARPSKSEACRVGDARVLNSPDYEVAYRPHPLNPDSKIACDVDHRGKY